LQPNEGSWGRSKRPVQELLPSRAMTMPVAVAAILASYVLGSVSFALLIVRALNGVDLRTVGSGNLGATNAGRILGRRWAVGVYLLDFLKGLVPTWIGLHAEWDVPAAPYLPLAMLMGGAAFLGHCFPFYLGFKGGKGVATASGVILAVSWPAFFAGMIAFIVTLLLSRMVALGSIVAAIVLPVAFLSTERRAALELPNLSWLSFFLAIAVLVIVRHRTNIRRMVEGSESKIGRPHS